MKIKKKNVRKCCYSNKYIGGKDVIIVDYVLDYVKKLGYDIKRSTNLSLMNLLTLICLCSVISFFIINLSYLAFGLTDHTQIINEDCFASNLGINVLIHPCNAEPLYPYNIIQYVNFTWLGLGNQETSWIFVYDGNISQGKIEYFNKSLVHQEYLPFTEHVYINNFTLNNVVSYEDLGTPNELCLSGFGSSNNEYMYNVTRNNNTIIYCFSDYILLNPSTFLISGWYDNFTIIDYNVTGTWVNVNIDYLGYNLLGNNKSYYTVQDYTFKTGETIETRWTYTPLNNDLEGKWSIFGYAGHGISDLYQSINNEQYIYIDPSWTAQFNKNLTQYYKFNESNIAPMMFKESLHGILNGSNINVATGRGGIINNSFLYGGTIGNPNITLPINKSYINTPLTISLWSKRQTGGNGIVQYFMDYTVNSSSDRLGLIAPTSQYYVFGGLTSLTAPICSFGEWCMITYVYNGSNEYLYINGTLYNSALDTNALINQTYRLGNDFSFTYDYAGFIDELGIWDRALSANEVQQLYNNGSGITYGFDFPPNATLIYPENNTNVSAYYFNETTGNITFNVLYEDDLELSNASIFIYFNDSLYLHDNFNVNGIYNLTYRIYNFSNNGTYTYYSIVTDTGNQNYISENNTFNITIMTAPSIFFIDLETTAGLMFLIIMLIIAIGFYLSRIYVFSGLMGIFIGFVLMGSGVNLYLSGIVILFSLVWVGFVLDK